MDIRIPKLGEGADSGVVVSLLVQEGEMVEMNQTILELENEKAVAPIPSVGAGKIEKIHVKVGDKVSVGQVIATLSGKKNGDTTSASATSQAAPLTPPPIAQPTANAPSTSKSLYQSPSGFAPPASPSVRKIARELGIDLTRVPGSERGGRIVTSDLRNYITQLQQASPSSTKAASAAPAPVSMDFGKWGKVTKKKVTSLRKTIGRKMWESWAAIPHVTQFDEADITDLVAIRKKYGAAYEKKGVKLTLTSFALKAVVEVLKKYPVFNASLDDVKEEIVFKEYYHLGVAVDTEGGLIVPVLRDVDKKTVFELSKELGEIAEKTRARKVAVDDLKGGTFTISNLGGIGGTHFTPVINRPETAILAMGRGVLKPIVTKDKSIVPRLMMPVGVSYDHRVIDGADGARFITDLVKAFQSFKDEDVKP